MRLGILPEKAAGGVGTVIDNLRRLLGNHEFVPEADADLVISHVGTRRAKEIDVLWTHGMYPTGEPGWNGSHESVNRAIMRAAAEALEVVAVSEWGARAILRYTGRRATVIPNGIFWHDWTNVSDPNGFVLWPKIGTSPVVDPRVFTELARAPYQFAAFFKARNIERLKVYKHDEMPQLFSRTAVLVSVTKENDSLMVMEAMAAGVPVLALRNGIFTSGKYRHMQGCYIAEREEELRAGLDWLMANHWEQSNWARVYSGYFDLPRQKPAIEALLERALEKKREQPRVSIVIPNYNYGRFLKAAVDSARRQTVPCEVIVVDDASTDGSLKTLEGSNVTVLAKRTNEGVSAARNDGIGLAKGNFILCLDADDTLEPGAVEAMLEAMKDRRTAMVFGPVTFCDERMKRLGEFFTKPANPLLQERGSNQVPTMALFRKDWWERVGGYDREMEYCEDAHLWLKMFQLDGVPGFTPKIIARYRGHEGSQFKRQAMKPRWAIPFRRKVHELDTPPLTLVLESEDDMSLRRAFFRLDEEYPRAHITDLRESPRPSFILINGKVEIPEWIRQY